MQVLYFLEQFMEFCCCNKRGITCIFTSGYSAINCTFQPPSWYCFYLETFSSNASYCQTDIEWQTGTTWHAFLLAAILCFLALVSCSCFLLLDVLIKACCWKESACVWSTLIRWLLCHRAGNVYLLLVRCLQILILLSFCWTLTIGWMPPLCFLPVKCLLPETFSFFS